MARVFVCLMVLLLGVDFEVGYLWQLARGQVRLLFKAEPIDRVLQEGHLSAQDRAKLELVQAIRVFAREKIGLEASKNYTTYVDIGSGPVSWNLVVCPTDRLEPLSWSYPVVGTVPYRGYFDREGAEQARDKYASEGYDTYLRPVGAYSTLGWFSDPILSTMLRYSEVTLADLIIHELTHATVWIEGDVTFNESLASFVGEIGALMWLEEKYGAGAQEVKHVLAEREDQVVFRKFMHEIATQLDSLYQTVLSRDAKLQQKEAIFDAARARFSQLPLKTDLYDSFPNWQLNNARLALYRVYRERTDLFWRIYKACGEDLKETVRILIISEQRSDPARWLEVWVEKQ